MSAHKYGWFAHDRKPGGPSRPRLGGGGRERFPGLPVASNRKQQAMERTRRRNEHPIEVQS